ncbi:MAG: sulfate adenylyltransferase [Methylacidiphilales bacterium]|nr:sulfate adenylyltransferase [Candidatus Methylacidiphilales bacterium]
MIAPFQSSELRPTLVGQDEKNQLIRQWDKGSEVTMSALSASFATLMASGYLSPFNEFMSVGEAMQVAKNYKNKNGLFCPIPLLHVTNQTLHCNQGDLLLLRDPNSDQDILGVQRVASIEQISSSALLEMATLVFGTSDQNHPGVASCIGHGTTIISGPVHSFNLSYFPNMFPDTFRTAGELRSMIAQLGWNRVVAFQTRNPMHRAHEELCRMALQQLDADGLLIHMLLGKLKQGDIPAPVRDQAIRVMVNKYFDPKQVIIAGYGFDMLYAGPREALLHALMRQNAGASHLIIGRDHAGVGDYYQPFAAQEIFDQVVPSGTFEIEIFKADTTAWSKKLHRVVMMKDVKDHSHDDFIQLSGTKVRALLSEGASLPEEFTRPEVATVLRTYYQSLKAV